MIVRVDAFTLTAVKSEMNAPCYEVGWSRGELCHHEDYATIAEAKASIVEYIEVFYNRIHRHSSLGYVSLVEFECSKSS